MCKSYLIKYTENIVDFPVWHCGGAGSGAVLFCNAGPDWLRWGELARCCLHNPCLDCTSQAGGVLGRLVVLPTSRLDSTGSGPFARDERKAFLSLRGFVVLFKVLSFRVSPSFPKLSPRMNLLVVLCQLCQCARPGQGTSLVAANCSLRGKVCCLSAGLQPGHPPPHPGL